MKNEIEKKELEKFLIQKEMEFKEIARNEGEKGRNQALYVLTIITVVLGIAAAVGIQHWLSVAAERAVERTYSDNYHAKARQILEKIKNSEKRANEQLKAIDDIVKQLNEQKISLNKHAWMEVKFRNGWQNFGKEFNRASYTIDAVGRVYLRGLVKGGEKNNPIFSLPKKYCPLNRELFIVKTENGQSRVDVLPNGDVLVLENFNQWVSLDGVNFGTSEQK